MMADTGSSFAGEARAYWDHGRDAVRELDERLEDMVRDHPLATVFAAVGFGIAVGILLTVACPASFPQLKHRE
jgi:ElaB/YqjD/DUF883 family membrane-anchored ribosome-binding protein